MNRALLRSLPLLPSLAVVASIACTTSEPPDEIISTPGAPAPRGAEPAAPPPAPGPSSSGGCEDFGALSAGALVAVLDPSAPAQMASFSVSGRPVATSVRVIAYGEASALVGKPSVLGAGENANLATCTHCVLVGIGCAPDCSAATWFYPRKGMATLTAVASQAGQPFQGSLEDVELEQVTVDPSTLTSTPVAGGACIRIPSLTFSATTEPSDGPASDAGASDAGTSGYDSGTDGSTSGGGKGGGRDSSELSILD